MSQDLEKLVARCADARKRYEGSEIDYYEFLFGIQEDAKAKEVWGVFTTFETFIEKCVGRPNPAKWTRYVKARQVVGLARIREIGIPASFEALEIADPKVRGVFFEEAGEWSKQHNGVHASEQYAELVRHNVDPKPERATPSINRARETEKLRAENEELRRECGRLKKENEKLRSELANLSTLRAPVKKGSKSHKELGGA